jgi:hypothetical protein
VSTDLILPPQQLTLDLPAIQRAAAGRVFQRYRERVADATRRRHDADLGCFVAYLAAIGVVSLNAQTRSKRPAPNPALARLEAFVGTWQWEGRLRASRLGAN